jgi:putative membrane protein
MSRDRASSEDGETREGSKQELAEDRTDWAQERTLLAKERTFSAWGRTGMSAMAVGLGIARLLDVTDSPWIARTIGAVLIVTGGAIFALGFFSYRKALKQLADEGVRGMSIWAIGILTFGLMVSAALALLLIFQE